jgi:hypothetical protein
MHVAWSLGIRTLSIFLATANPFETGPYGPGHVVLKPSLPCHPCDHNIVCNTYYCKQCTGPETIADSAVSLLEGRTSPPYPEVTVLKTTHDIDSMCELVPIRPVPWSLEQFAMLCWRSIMPATLDGDLNLERILLKLKVRIQRFFQMEPVDVVPRIVPEIPIVAEALGMAESAIKTCEAISRELMKENGSYMKVMHLSQELADQERYLRKWAYVNKHWEFAVNMLMLSLRTFPLGQDIKYTALLTEECFRRFRKQIELLYKVLLNIIEEGRDEINSSCRWENGPGSRRDLDSGRDLTACPGQ